jgi:protein-S-isoprenylcysteine O-methyltransferase Ste14
MRIAVLFGIVLLCVSGAVYLVRQGSSRDTLIAAGVLVATGLPLVIVSRRQLGTAFSVGPRARALVTHGLYARIPHPMYVFLDVMLLGLIVALRQTWLLALWVAVILVQVWQARREARVLEGAFGDAYRAYRRQTWW